MKQTGKALVAIAAVSLVGTFAAAGVATADPSGAPTYRVLVGQGSDTTQDVVNGLATAVTASGTDYYNTGLLYAATAAGATSIQTSLLPAVGDTIKIDISESGTVTAATSATSFTVSYIAKVGDPITVGGVTSTVSAVSGVTVSPEASVVTTAAAVNGGTTPTAGTAVTGATQETDTVSAVTPAVASSGSGVVATPYNTVTLGTALAFPHAANADVIGSAVAAGSLVMGSYNAVGGAFQSKANANCQYIANNANSTQFSGTTQNGVVYTSNGGATSGTTNVANGTAVVGGRANGSGNGGTALGDAMNPANGIWGCTDFARASSAKAAAGAGTAVNIPFALDGVTFGVTTTSGYPRILSYADLHAIYTCTYPGEITASTVIPAGTTTANYANANGLLYAQLPQAGSGTRSFVEAAVGILDSQVASLPCITSQKADGTTLEEHDLRYTDDLAIAPISIAQSIAQRAAALSGVSDKQGRTVLVTLDTRTAANNPNANGTTGWAGNAALNYALNMAPKFGGATAGGSQTIGTTAVTGIGKFWREVYNIVPANRLHDPNIQAAFVGATSAVCSHNDVLALYGFQADANCGLLSASSLK